MKTPTVGQNARRVLLGESARVGFHVYKRKIHIFHVRRSHCDGRLVWDYLCSSNAYPTCRAAVLGVHKCCLNIPVEDLRARFAAKND